MPDRELYVGTLSGTSADGVDSAVVEFESERCVVLHARTVPYPAALHERVTALIESPTTSLAALGALDAALGEFFGTCVLESLSAAGIEPTRITAIGHHGQTVFHQPLGPERSTLQIGDPNRVASRTGITTVADFRRLDMALGGQGAPLMSAFHAWLLAGASEAQAVVNIGGIANVTLCRPGQSPTGFDTGPGNTLLDLWMQRHRGDPFDRGGRWGSGGTIDKKLLECCMADEYFARPAPKSTGREHFHLAWLESKLAECDHEIAPQNVQTTLCELTAASIASALEAAKPLARLVVCGGGAFNAFLLERLSTYVAPATVVPSDLLGIGPAWIEAAGFAWLARMRIHGRCSNSPSVTGARRAASLGGVYSP